MFSLRPPTDGDLERLIRAQDRFSYDDIGATRATLPAGFRHDRWEAVLGPDDGERFHRAAQTLRAFGAQRGVGFRIVPDRPVEDGLTFALVVRAGPLFVTAVGRVVYVIDEPDCYRFAYGTLDAHPECGEESFAVVREEGVVRFEIIAFSRPSHPLARLGKPLTRVLQVRATRAYIAAMQRAAAS